MQLELLIPRVSNNDDQVTVVETFAPDLSEVKAGQIIIVLEDSKASFEVEAEASGYIRWRVKPGAQCRVGDSMARVYSDLEAARGDSFSPQPVAVATSAPHSYTITAAAQSLIDAHSITAAELASLGAAVIRSSDLLALVEKRSAAPSSHQTMTLSKRQIAIGRVVSQSHAAVPQAFLIVRVNCDALLEQLGRRPLGLLEVLIKMVGDRREKFPEFFATLQDPATLKLHGPAVNVGVTLDLGHGLFIPTLRDIASRSLDQIAEELKILQRKAMDGSFHGDDLTEAHLSISLNMAADVVLSMPIIPPGQTAMLSLAGVLEDVYIDESGQAKARRYTNLGLAYDHRVINGAYALQLLQAIKRRIEAPQALAWLK